MGPKYPNRRPENLLSIYFGKPGDMDLTVRPQKASHALGAGVQDLGTKVRALGQRVQELRLCSVRT